jgi:Glycosyltransferase Family 4
VTGRRVLVVSPHFPPVNAPDHQRVRMMLPHLAEFGWQAEVVAFHPDAVEAARDPDLAATVPPDTAVTTARALPYKWTRPFGLGNLVWRGGWAFRRAAERRIRAVPFDLAFFSTTIFGVLPLGPRWRRRHGLPYVLDFQDPWVSDYYQQTGVRPPGGRLRYGLSQRAARRAEPDVVRQAGHVIAVSPAYPKALVARYPDVPAGRFTVLPFAANPRDFDVVRERGIRQPVFDPADGLRHWVYLGRGGADMAKALRGLFLALRDLRDSVPAVGRLRLHFVGTSYAPGALAEETVAPVARACGVGDLVQEQTGRLPYLQGLALLRAADTILVTGSDDPGYSASKVYPCVAAGRPVLAVLHRDSAAGAVVTECKAGEVVGFDAADTDEALADRLAPVLREHLRRPSGERPATDWRAFEPYTAREMTRRLCAVFDRTAGARA